MLEIDISQLETDLETLLSENRRSGPLFKDIALQLLKDAYPKPLRAAEVQAAAEAKLSRKFHSKTPGMSLYRLAKEGLVERRGWDWFYLPESEKALRYEEAFPNGAEPSDEGMGNG